MPPPFAQTEEFKSSELTADLSRLIGSSAMIRVQHCFGVECERTYGLQCIRRVIMGRQNRYRAARSPVGPGNAEVRPLCTCPLLLFMPPTCAS